MHIEALPIEYGINIEISTEGLGESELPPLQGPRQGGSVSESSSLDSLSGPSDHLG